MPLPARAPASGEPVWDWPALRRDALAQARRLVGPEEAEDAAQEALIRAWRGRHRCRSPAAPLPWLRTIVRNEALRLRAHGNGRAQPGDEERLEAAQDPGDAPEERLLRRMTVDQALDTLDNDERRLVVLRYMHDLRQREIATILGIPETTVRVRLHRIRKRLGILIGDQF